MKFYQKLTFLLFCLLGALSAPSHAHPVDPLPSWSNTTNKQTILKYVETVTSKNSVDFVPEEYRVATFDMDGTIVVEKPTPVMIEFLYDYYENPEIPSPKLAIVGRKPGEWVTNNITDATLSAAYFGYTQEKYNESVLEFIKTHKNSVLNRLFVDSFYQPMLELIKYLQEKQFRVFIVSGSTEWFVRSAVRSQLKMNNSNLIGTETELTYSEEMAEITLNGISRLPTVVNEGKPKVIMFQIGVRPILAFGNSSGDQQMLEYASANQYKSLALFLEHDDAEREFVYPSGVIKQPGWLQISMKNDFAVLFEEK